MNNILVGVIVLALILGGVGFWVNNNQQGAEVALETKKTADAEGMSVVGEQPVAVAPGGFAWTLTDTGVQSEFGAPVSSVKLTYNGKTYDFGGFDGSCFVVEDSAWKLVEGELSGVICYFAGGGYEIGIFNEGGKLIAKKGELSEGDAETPSFRGNFTQILVVE